MCLRRADLTADALPTGSLGVADAEVRPLDMTKDLVDHLRERPRRVDHHSAVRDVLLGPVQPDDEVALGRFRAPFVVRALVEPPMQGLEIDVENEDLVEKLREPPQKKVRGSWWSATRARTRPTSQMWCWCRAVSVASPVSGSPW